MKRLFYLLLSISTSSAFIFCSNADKANAARHTMTGLKEDSIVKPTGLIAYTRNDSEIRLIDSTGSIDKQLWTHPDAKAPFGISIWPDAPMARTGFFQRAREHAFIISCRCLWHSSRRFGFQKNNKCTGLQKLKQL